MSTHLINLKIKDNILKEFNANLYSNFNMTISDADDLYGLYEGHMYKVIDKVFKNHGPIGLRNELRYIIQFFKFLFIKLDDLFSLDKKELPYPYNEKDWTLKHIFAYIYFRRSYHHYDKRNIAPPTQLRFKFYNYV